MVTLLDENVLIECLLPIFFALDNAYSALRTKRTRHLAVYMFLCSR